MKVSIYRDDFAMHIAQIESMCVVHEPRGPIQNLTDVNFLAVHVFRILMNLGVRRERRALHMHD